MTVTEAVPAQMSSPVDRIAVHRDPAMFRLWIAGQGSKEERAMFTRSGWMLDPRSCDRRGYGIGEVADERAAGQLPQLLGGLAVTRRDGDAGVLSFGATDGGRVDGGVADGVVPGESESEVEAGRRYPSPQKNITIEWCTRSTRKACPAST
jgi:hypothetical protein